MSGHPLDRPVWSAFTGRQAALAIADGPAVRVRPDIGIFAAAAAYDAAGLAALARLAEGAPFAVVEAEAPPAPPGYRMLGSKACLQMVLERPIERHPDVAFVDLGPCDADEMLALAILTEPGPFKSNTHELGGFIGLRSGGKLVAMAGQRLQPDGHVEVSGVCTHPDHRGRGHAAALMTIVAARVQARGDIPILHTYADNGSAILLYEKLGFRTARSLTLSTFAPI